MSASAAWHAALFGRLHFSLLELDSAFHFEDHVPAAVEEFKLAGKGVEIKMKHKGQPSDIESAFLKESPEVFDIGFATEKQLATFDAKIGSIDFDGAKLDVKPYLKDESELDIWSRNFFRQMVRKMTFRDRVV